MIAYAQLASIQAGVTISPSDRKAAPVAAIRRDPKCTSGGCGRGTEPPNVDRYVVRKRVRFRPANDNALIHGGREALWTSAGIVLTFGAWLLVLRIIG